ncbi:MAG: [Fe-Fe] hydrogenase large subunit C-terminal domain-containing protein [Myxococcales bacterium]|jgi:iron only hydrogenase large subunit-like protein
MNLLNPIHTERRECQDCYKCVRCCPVKAIKFENNYASVIPELCVLCGACVEACPNGAKRVRDDLPRARQLLELRDRVFVSLAPSYAAEFPGMEPSRLIAALERLGFAGVSETALGAQQVSANVAGLLEQGSPRAYLSSACPTAVAFVQKYLPAQSELVTDLLSPALAHARMLRQRFGEQIGIVFVGPCIAKKHEADTHPELIDVVLTFEDLRRWLQHERIDPEWTAPEPERHRFVPCTAEEGALYPVDGGMVAGIRAHCTVSDARFMTFSGLRNIERGLQGIEQIELEAPLFVELLACEGGCVSGPKTSRDQGTAAKRYRILRHAPYPDTLIPRRPERGLDISCEQRFAPVVPARHTEAEVREVLRSVGKFSIEDEHNCGGCGYDTCREFAKAFLDGKAERTMCVTYMRKLATKKANALMRKMPSAVVIVDEKLRVIEHNESFVRMFARPGDAQEPLPDLDGAAIQCLVPFPNLFNAVLKTGEDLLDRDLRHRDTILHGSIFSIEKHRVVGGLFQDITRPAVQKQQIISKAREVIQKNLATVQQIAYLLGENAAESESILDSIIESFSAGELGEQSPDPHDWKRLYRG